MMESLLYKESKFKERRQGRRISQNILVRLHYSFYSINMFSQHHLFLLINCTQFLVHANVINIKPLLKNYELLYKNETIIMKSRRQCALFVQIISS